MLYKQLNYFKLVKNSGCNFVDSYDGTLTESFSEHYNLI